MESEAVSVRHDNIHEDKIITLGEKFCRKAFGSELQAVGALHSQIRNIIEFDIFVEAFQLILEILHHVGVVGIFSASIGGLQILDVERDIRSCPEEHGHRVFFLHCPVFGILNGIAERRIGKGVRAVISRRGGWICTAVARSSGRIGRVVCIGSRAGAQINRQNFPFAVLFDEFVFDRGCGPVFGRQCPLDSPRVAVDLA